MARTARSVRRYAFGVSGIEEVDRTATCTAYTRGTVKFSLLYPWSYSIVFKIQYCMISRDSEFGDIYLLS